MPRKKSAGKVTPIKKSNQLTQQDPGLVAMTDEESMQHALRAAEKIAAAEKAALPTTPSPLVVSLQGQIASIVEGRSALVNQIASASRSMQLCNAELKALQDMLRQSEDEVQYRMGLIAQAEGRPIQNFATLSSTDVGHRAYVSEVGYWPRPDDMVGAGSIPGTPMAVPMVPINPGFAGAGSIPAPTNRAVRQADPNDFVNKSVVTDEERFG